MSNKEPPKCYHCHQEIAFDDKWKTPTGKKMPLDPSTMLPHDCPNNPYKKTKQEFVNKANQAVDSAFTDKPALERIENKLNKFIELVEAVLINQGLYKPASDLE